MSRVPQPSRSFALAALALLLALPSAAGEHAEAPAPLRARGDAELAALAAALHLDGRGTAADPFVLADRVLGARAAHGLHLEGTRLHVVVRNVTITGGGETYDGIRLVDAQNVVIQGCTLEGNRHGVHVASSADVTIRGTSIKTSRVGVLLDGSTGVTLRDNRIAVNDRDVSLRASTGNLLRNNNLSIATGQVGVHFDDLVSLDNDADATNVVNGEPLRWIAGRGGAPDAPIRVANARVELPGITNLAQVLVHRAQHVALENLTAKGGLGAGILLSGARDVTLTDVVLEGNGRAGLAGTRVERVELVRVVATSNGGAGVNLVDADGARLRGVRASGNGGAGVQLADVRGGASVEGLVVERNAGAGLLLSDAPGVAVAGMRALENGGAGAQALRAPGLAIVASNISRNAADGVLVVQSNAANMTRNHLVDNLGAGIHLATTTRAELASNVLRGGPASIHLEASPRNALASNMLLPSTGGVGIRFDDEASYDNAIATTNLHHGEPVRWHARVGGSAEAPLRLDGLDAQAPGVTNVAQAAVVHASHVRIEGAVVANGTRHGLLLHNASNTSLLASAVRHNAQDGVRIESSADVEIRDTVVRRNGAVGVHALRSERVALVHDGLLLNGADGARFEASPGARLEDVTAEENRARGIAILASRGDAGATIASGTLRRNAGGGLLVEDANLTEVSATRFSQNGPFGALLKGVREAARVANNTFENHTAAIRLGASAGLAFHDNAIAARRGQDGFHFEDRASYENRIGPDNLYNALPVRWYVEPRGTAEAPFVLRGVEIASPGVTNVAQVFVLRGEHVLLEDVRVRNGEKDGLLVQDSHNVTLRRVFAFHNEGDGLRFTKTEALRVHDSRSSDNGRDGVRIEGGKRADLRGVIVERNGGAGIRAEDVALHAEGVTARRSGGHGAVVEGAQAELARLVDARFGANGGDGLLVRGARVGEARDVEARENAGAGVRLAATLHGNLSRLDAAANGEAGLAVEDASLGNVTDSRFTGQPVGLSLVRPKAPVRVAGSVFENHTRAVTLQDAVGGVFAGNAITMGARQTGFHFADVRSYDNAIPTSNTVNGVAVQWHARVANVTLPRATVDVPGITNVAQVMVYRGENVTLASPVAQDGIGDGVLVFASHDVVVVDANATGNRGYGLAASGGSNVTFAGGASIGNRAGGAVLDTAESALDRVDVRGSRGFGVRVTAPGAAVRNATVADNGDDGVRLKEAPGARVADSFIARNGRAGIHLLEAGPGVQVERNRLDGNADGIRLARTQLARLDANVLTMAPGSIGLRFDDEVSYDNRIGATNTVNGVPVRWYTALAGTEQAPIVLEDVRVDLPGITNVAQVMIHRSAYVQLTDATASNGVARGVYVHRSSAVTVERATAEHNEVGIHLDRTQSSKVLDARAAHNGVAVRLTSSGSNVVAHVNATGAARGVELDAASEGNRVHATLASGVREASVVDPSVRGGRANNLLVDAGRDVRAGLGRPVAFAEALVASRFESERVVHQQWDFGDGMSTQRAQGAPYRPSHLYAAPGTYVATLQVRTADGQTYADTTTVRVSGPISPPVNLRVTQGGGVASVAWDAPRSDGGSPITAYRVYRGDAPGQGELLAEVRDATSLLDAADVRDDARRHYAVAAVTAEGEGPQSAWVQASAGSRPDAPRGLTADAGASRVTLAWEPPAADGGLPVRDYVVLRAAEGEAEAQPVAEVAQPRFVDTSVLDGVAYTYRVVARNALGESPPSDTATARPSPVPDAPGNLTALAGDRRVTLAWSAPHAFADAPVLHYRVWRGAAADGEMALVAQVAGLWHRDEGLSNAEEYAYAVSAVTRAGEGPRTRALVAAPTPVDLAAPRVVLVEPANGTMLSVVRPVIAAEFVDDSLDVLASLRVDGVEVARATGAATRVAWQPPEALRFGEHAATLRVEDAAGHAVERSWRFRLLSPDEEGVRLAWSNLTLPGVEIALGETIEVRAHVRNVGFVPADLDAPLHVGPDLGASTRVRLAPGEATDVVLEVTPARAGRFAVALGNAEPVWLTVVALDEDAPPEEPAPAGNASQPPPEEGQDVTAGGTWAAAAALAGAAWALRARRRG